VEAATGGGMCSVDGAEGADLAAFDAGVVGVDLAVAFHEDTELLLELPCPVEGAEELAAVGFGEVSSVGGGELAGAVGVADCGSGRVAVSVDVVDRCGWFAASGESSLGVVESLQEHVDGVVAGEGLELLHERLGDSNDLVAVSHVVSSGSLIVSVSSAPTAGVAACVGHGTVRRP